MGNEDSEFAFRAASTPVRTKVSMRRSLPVSLSNSLISMSPPQWTSRAEKNPRKMVRVGETWEWVAGTYFKLPALIPEPARTCGPSWVLSRPQRGLAWTQGPPTGGHPRVTLSTATLEPQVNTGVRVSISERVKGAEFSQGFSYK